MSLQWQLAREVPADTAQLGRTILRPENVFRQIGDRFNDLFPLESRFVHLYEPTGRGAIPPLLLALVTVFQMLEKVPDRLAAEWVVSRIDWKYALHLPLAYTGFHFNDLYAFRQRLLAHQQERLVFEDLLQRLQALGLIKRRGKVRTDATHVLGLVEHLSQLELVTESLRLALRATTEADPDWVEQQLPASFCETYERRQSDYGLSQLQVQAKLLKAGQDGFWFLAQIERSASRLVQALAEVATLRTVLEQQFPQGPGGPPAARRPAGGDIIESPHETEVRRTFKRSQGWTGYKAQVSETCDADRPQLITDLEPTPAPAPDSPMLPAIQGRLQARQLLPGEQYVDQGYISGAHIAASLELGIDLVGPPPGDMPGPEGFRQTDFHVDEPARQVTCPAGEVSVVWSERHAGQEGPATVKVRFAAATCRVCSFFGRCTSSCQGRSLELHSYREVLAGRRAEAETAAYRQRLQQRAAIEGTISELVRGHRLRFARYRGLAKLRLQCLFTAVAANLKRLARWWAQACPSKAAVVAT